MKKTAASLTLVVGIVALVPACTQAEVKTAQNIDAAALNDTQAACATAALLEAAVPPTAVALSYITEACPALVGLETAVQAWLSNVAAQQSSAPVKAAALKFKSAKK
jgi:hypothetical protein